MPGDGGYKRQSGRNVVLGATRNWKMRNKLDFYDGKNEKRITMIGKEVDNSHRYQDSRTLFKWADQQ